MSRASGIPTVVTNVLAGAALAQRSQSAPVIAALAVAMVGIYVAGHWLDDAFDRDSDRKHRPSRSIPAGTVSAGNVFDLAIALLVLAVGLVATVAIGAGGGIRIVALAIALTSLVVLVAADSTEPVPARLVLGACRACVYLIAGLALRDDLTALLVIGALSVAVAGSLARPFTACIAIVDAMWLAWFGHPALAALAIVAAAVAGYGTLMASSEIT